MPKKRPDAAQGTGDAPPVKLQDHFGRNFKTLRSQLGLTQRDVAKASGIAQNDISLIERGRINLTIGTMERLAKVVDHDVTNLLAETPPALTRK